MRVHMQASEVHAFTPDEVLGMVEPGRLQAIKAKDPAPEIRVYAVAHEGRARGKLLNIGTVAVNYAADLVRRIAGRLRTGTAVFFRHSGTNSHAGREPIGEIVGTAVREIRGKLHALAAVWVKPERRAESLDIASIEAEMEFEDRGGYYEAADVSNVSALALSDSRLEQPGFEGARLLGAAAFFVSEVEVNYADPLQNDFIPTAENIREDRILEDTAASRGNDFIP